MYRARSSTLQHARSARVEPTDPGGDRLMNGLYSFCDLSVMQQAFWASCNPSIRFKITLAKRPPANEKPLAYRASDHNAAAQVLPISARRARFALSSAVHATRGAVHA